MHRQIVGVIQKFVEDSPWSKEAKVYVHNNQLSSGFWAINIVFSKEAAALWLPHVKQVAMSIGFAYGEGLAIEELTTEFGTKVVIIS